MNNNFRDQLNKAYDEKVLKKHKDVVRYTALTVFTQIVQNTPVDTGRARSNWHIDVNNVDVRLVEPNNEDPSAKAMNATATYKIDDRIFISNNLPYIRRLDEGYSQQAPAGFVDAAIQVGVRQAEELAKR